MNFKLTEKDISLIKVISQIAGGFTLIIGITMIFTLVQLKVINPLDSPVLLSVKEQFDKDPENASKAEQVRAMDLMARKAYFSSRWQVEAGSYLLLAGGIIFILCQQLILSQEKRNPLLSPEKPVTSVQKGAARKYLLITASVICGAAVVASFVLRSELPGLSGQPAGGEVSSTSGKETAPKPDKSNYPFFRGQDGRGVAGGSGFPTEWDGVTGKNISWKIGTLKPGKSSPVIWDDKLFVTGAQDKTCEIYCINKQTGALIWTGTASGIQGEPAVLPEMDQEAGLAVSSVATNGKEVCAIFANGNLICFDMDGNLQWSKNIGVPETSYGYASSLIIYKNILLVQFDSNTKISLIGFDIATGDQKWETLRKGRAVWSSPVLGYFNGSPQLVINGNPAVTGFDPVSGKELWAVECMSGDVAPSVAVNSSMVYAVTDYAKLAAIKPGAGASIVWQDNTYTPDVSSPVANDEFLFLTTGNGDVACYNSVKGDTLWTHYFMDQFYASPIIADDMVYLLDRSGVTHIVKAKSSYQLVSEAALGEAADCSPAFSDKKIYIRGKKNLYCIANN